VVGNRWLVIGNWWDEIEIYNKSKLFF